MTVDSKQIMLGIVVQSCMCIASKKKKISLLYVFNFFFFSLVFFMSVAANELDELIVNGSYIGIGNDRLSVGQDLQVSFSGMSGRLFGVEFASAVAFELEYTPASGNNVVLAHTGSMLRRERVPSLLKRLPTARHLLPTPASVTLVKGMHACAQSTFSRADNINSVLVRVLDAKGASLLQLLLGVWLLFEIVLWRPVFSCFFL